MNIELKDTVLLIVGFILGSLSSWLLSSISSKKEEKMIASYHLEEGDFFYFEYINGYKKKRFTKRNIYSDHEVEVGHEEFTTVKPNLERRSIP